jgi:hypothetical protein
MIRRQTIITFKVPATFAAERTEAVNGKLVGFGPGGKISFDGLEVVSISRRGHVDPAKMRDLAVARGATETELTVSHHSIRDYKSYTDTRYIVNAAGPAKPIKVTI